MRILAFPRLDSAYTSQFYAAVEALQVEVVDGVWSGHWLRQTVQASDVLHFHWPSFYYSTKGSLLARCRSLAKFSLFLLLARLKGGRIVWTAHNLYPHDGGKTVEHRFARWVITRLASVVLVHGETAAKRIMEELSVPAQKIVRIAHGHWLNLFPQTLTRAQAGEALGIAPTAYVYGFIGLCKPYKGLEALISSFHQLPSDAVLLIAGKFQSGDYQNAIEQLLSGIDAARLVFVPRFLTEMEMQNYALACDAMVFPYSDVLTSGSVMTAFTFGRPAIVPDRGSMREAVLPELGIVYDPDEPEALLKAMTTVRTVRYEGPAIQAYAKSQAWENSASLLIERLSKPIKDGR